MIFQFSMDPILVINIINHSIYTISISISMKTSSPVKEALDDDFPFSSEYNWQDRQMIGQGGFATVYKVLNKKTG